MISTAGTRIIGPFARTLELPLLLWPGVFSLFFLSRGADFLGVFTPFAEGQISDYIAHGLIIRGFTAICLFYFFIFIFSIQMLPVVGFGCYKISACTLSSSIWWWWYVFYFASISDITRDFGYRYLGRGGKRLGGIEMCTSIIQRMKLRGYVGY